MASVMSYWCGKEARKALAQKHTIEMQDKYSTQIVDAINNTVVYGEDAIVPEMVNHGKKQDTKIIIEDSDSVSAIMQMASGKTAVLNFASYKNPGGMFIEGSRAQEECLCHASFLYNVLKEESSYYDWNNNHKNWALYRNRALYTPNIMFFNDNAQVCCDVITCAAPNYSAYSKYNTTAGQKPNNDALASRILFILSIAKAQQVDTLILGAFGCGVFGQDARTVARMFKGLLQMERFKCFDTVVFAVPDGKDQNLKRFKEVFDGE